MEWDALIEDFSNWFDMVLSLLDRIDLESYEKVCFTWTADFSNFGTTTAWPAAALEEEMAFSDIA